ncbi:SDR family NAD(P)-dependent oxidoreductase [Sphingomonas naphthae]|uniref:SDR family NAD(P)-dependent oxidoreductase n=1 Tax=Sphingomonas naphthae TaxID=1813468 RepID=A0ABY7TH33_9SPHN|nr:SDR family NAD(P)-dependent oxidoreductase [Sphingomonas naphthae]WCT72173.1 SDR family NAD(P)-dependent oxidoreductase [Sphingomonas naphthae]
MEGLDGKVAVVTGAARGIGRAVALRLARAGADVAILDIDLDAARQWNEALSADTVMDEVRALGRRSSGLAVDLTQRDRVFDVMQAVVYDLGAIDILVNAAGGFVTPEAESYASSVSDADMRILFSLNYESAVHCCQAAVGHMRTAGRGGSIVNISSQAGSFPRSTGALAHYGASKAALNSFTRTLAGEVGPDGIRVNAVLPGYTMTARVSAVAASRGVGEDLAAGFPLRRFAQPDDIAKVVSFFASDLASFVTGQLLLVNGGATLSAY